MQLNTTFSLRFYSYLFFFYTIVCAHVHFHYSIGYCLNMPNKIQVYIAQLHLTDNPKVTEIITFIL